MEDLIIRKIEKHYYAYNSIGSDIPEFRITEKELSELKNYLFSIFPGFPSNSQENIYMGIKLILVKEIK